MIYFKSNIRIKVEWNQIGFLLIPNIEYENVRSRLYFGNGIVCSSRTSIRHTVWLFVWRLMQFLVNQSKYENLVLLNQIYMLITLCYKNVVCFKYEFHLIATVLMCKVQGERNWSSTWTDHIIKRMSAIPDIISGLYFSFEFDKWKSLHPIWMLQELLLGVMHSGFWTRRMVLHNERINSRL